MCLAYKPNCYLVKSYSVNKFHLKVSFFFREYWSSEARNVNSTQSRTYLIKTCMLAWFFSPGSSRNGTGSSRRGCDRKYRKESGCAGKNSAQAETSASVICIWKVIHYCPFHDKKAIYTVLSLLTLVLLF